MAWVRGSGCDCGGCRRGLVACARRRSARSHSAASLHVHAVRCGVRDCVRACVRVRPTASSVRLSEHRDEIEQLMKTFLKESMKSRAVEAKLGDLERELSAIRAAQMPS